MKLLVSFSVLLLAGCTNMKLPNKSMFEKSHFSIHPYSFSISLPTTMNTDFPLSKTTPTFSLYQDNNKDFNDLLSRHYDYRSNYMQGVFGTLSISVRVNKWTSVKAQNQDNFSNFTNHLIKVKAIKQKSISIHGNKWYEYEYPCNLSRSNCDSLYYSIPLSERYYLQVIFHFINNDRSHKSGWRQKAGDLSNKIKESMVLNNEI